MATACGEIERAALLVDAREGGQIDKLPGIYQSTHVDHPATLVFVEASDEVLMRRFSETRRPHPLGEGVSVAEGIRAERRQDGADSPARRRGHRHFQIQRPRAAAVHDATASKMPAQQPLLISLVSFGFRYGIPADADLVFDVRFLPNPHFVPRLRPFSGKDPRVARYIRSFPQTNQFLAPHRKPAGVSDPALHSRRQKLFDGRSGMHGRAAPFGGAGRSDCAAALQAQRVCDKVVHRDLEKSALEPRGLCGGRCRTVLSPQSVVVVMAGRAQSATRRSALSANDFRDNPGTEFRARSIRANFDGCCAISRPYTALCSPAEFS